MIAFCFLCFLFFLTVEKKGSGRCDTSSKGSPGQFASYPVRTPDGAYLIKVLRCCSSVVLLVAMLFGGPPVACAANRPGMTSEEVLPWRAHRQAAQSDATRSIDDSHCFRVFPSL
jgi:hypothetical protein